MVRERLFEGAGGYLLGEDLWELEQMWCLVQEALPPTVTGGGLVPSHPRRKKQGSDPTTKVLLISPSTSSVTEVLGDKYR